MRDCWGTSEVASFLVEVVLVCAHCEFVAGCFVAYDDGMWMHLEHGRCPLVTDVAIDAVLEGSCLIMAAAYEQYFFCIHDGAYADCEGLFGHEVEVAVEEAAVGMDGVCGQRLDACTGGQ